MRLDRGQIEVIDATMATVLMAKTPVERLHIAFEIWESTRQLLTGYLQQLHPDWDDKTVQQQVAKRLSHGAV